MHDSGNLMHDRILGSDSFGQERCTHLIDPGKLESGL
jgi:hypothetical protein